MSYIVPFRQEIGTHLDVRHLQVPQDVIRVS
jgi:hypothetical protein